jgi:hypothetical protein
MKEEEHEQFDAEIGQTENPEDVARAELKRYQEVMGMTYENPDTPVAGQPGTGRDEFLG